MEAERLTYLYQQSLTGTATEQDKKHWLDAVSDPANQAFIQRMMAQTWDQVKESPKEDMPAETSNAIFQNIIKEAQESTTTKTERTTQPLWRYTAAIAAAIALIIAGIYFFNYNTTDNTPKQQQAQTDIAPGKQGATLTLASGKKIRLTEAQDGKLADEAGVAISKTKEGQLVYTIKGNTEAGKINTLSTQNGETYQVQLPDGTEVWLNSASSLTYASNLTQDGKRKVKLTGEGYFQVAKDKNHPFIVQTNNQEVEVLGTHFNINSYSDEPAITTTLLEGKVKVSANNKEKIIKPGQQAINTQNTLEVKPADLESITDWKDGDFNLADVDFKTAMRKIARWYNVEVIYDDNIQGNIQLGGWISRNKNLSSVLQFVEKTGMVHFKIAGSKIYVSK